MKFILAFLLFAAAVSLGSTYSRKCGKPCPRVYRPVCASNGRHYNNRCLFQNYKKCGMNKRVYIVHQGKCRRGPPPSPTPTPSPAPLPTNLKSFCNQKRPGNYHHPMRCDAYIACADRRVQVRNCPAKLWYDSRTDKCDWHWNVKCKVNCPILCAQNLYEPMCASNGVTFRNPCLFDHAAHCQNKKIKFLHKGHCTARSKVCPRPCPRSYFPVCASDMVTYANNCTFASAKECSNKNIRILYKGECKTATDPRCPTRCPNLYKPVCGSNGRTFSNMCELEHTQFCLKEKVKFHRHGNCNKKDKTLPRRCPRCPNIYSPVCATDGETYMNTCQLKYEVSCLNNNIKLRHNGTCNNKVVHGVCDVNPEDRQKCGYSGISKEACERLGCCFNGQWRSARSCYQKDTGNDMCSVNPENRVECGWPGIKKSDCEARKGCCFNNKTPGTKWCYASLKVKGKPRKPCHVVCSYMWDPVCGSNGKTYSNKCHLEQAVQCNNENVKVLYTGECPGSSPSPFPKISRCYKGCTYDMNPVCASNGRTYINRCMFENAARCDEPGISVTFTGRCTDKGSSGFCKPVCSFYYDPVCGTDGSTYDNDCLLKKDADCRRNGNSILHYGKCQKQSCERGCPFSMDPVCGSNGKTYNNKCMFENAKRCNKNSLPFYIRSYGSCKLDKIDKANCRKACGLNYEPVCASDGTTYDNVCLFRRVADCKNSKIKFLYYGRCHDCSLPMSKGNGRANIKSFYFDIKDKKCKQFRYGGIAGNGNRFRSETECKRKCNAAAFKNSSPFPSISRCQTPCPNLLDPVCASNGRTYVNRCAFKNAGFCDEPGITVQYSGRCLDAGSNGFCQRTCSFFFEPVCGTDGKTYDNECKLKKEADCNSNGNAVLHYGKCQKLNCERGCPFSMDPVCGSDGKTYNNKCMFENAKRCSNFTMYVKSAGSCKTKTGKADCKKACGFNYDPVCASDGSTYDNVCLFRRAADCKNSKIKFFYYGRCHDCSLPMSKGNGRANIKSFYFDIKDKKCKQFGYGGIAGNGNRFRSALECNRKCNDKTAKASMCIHAPCPLVYKPLCASNGKNYDSECQMNNAKKCGRENKRLFKLHDGKCTGREKICTKRRISNNDICMSVSRKYYYNVYKRECIPFIMRDCGGDVSQENLFDSERECMGFCHVDICSKPKNKGQCNNWDIRYFFDKTTGECEKFKFSGCDGNKNNFLTKKECETSCDRCTLKPERGDGYTNITSYYYNPMSKLCETFAFTGSNGNANRFITEAECRDVCITKRDAEKYADVDEDWTIDEDDSEDETDYESDDDVTDDQRFTDDIFFLGEMGSMSTDF